MPRPRGEGEPTLLTPIIWLWFPYITGEHGKPNTFARQ